MLEKMRLFIGLELPAEHRQALGTLDPGWRELRWVMPDQLHLTLSFLGEVEQVRLPFLQEKLEAVRVAPFFLPLQGVGSFNSRGQPSVVWVGVGRGHPHLFALHKRLQDAVLAAGLEPDLRPFKPHVTVGRARNLARSTLQPLLKQHAEDDFGLFPAEQFTLFSSILHAGGARYTRVLTVPLAGAA